MSTLYSPIRIILADDHELIRDGFQVMIKKETDIEVIAEAENGEELVKLTRSLMPDVIVTDIMMPKMNGIEATRQILQEFPHIGIIALSMFDDENLIIDMLQAGVKGYLLKNAGNQEIKNAIKSVYKDVPYYCRQTSVKLAKLIAHNIYIPSRQKQLPEFSDKEIIIIKKICEGLSNKEIGDQMALSKRTIEGYREKILAKMDVKHTAGIVIYAIKHKIFES